MENCDNPEGVPVESRPPEIENCDEKLEAMPVESMGSSAHVFSGIHSVKQENDKKKSDIDDKWICHICNQTFGLSCNFVFILMHFRNHQPSTNGDAPRLSTTSKHNFCSKANTLADITCKNELLECLTSSDAGRDEEIEGRGGKGQSRSINKNTSKKTAASTATAPTRTVAKKSCSGRPFDKKKRHKLQTNDNCDDSEPRTVAKKSCSGSKHGHKNKKVSCFDPEKFSERSARSVTPTASELKKEKRKKVPIADKNSKYEPPSKKMKVNPEPKKKTTKKLPKKVFPKPPLVKSCSKLSNVMLDSTAHMVNILGEPNPSVATLKKLMDTSFPYRKFRYENLVSIHDMLSTFPALRHWEILKYEFERFKRANFEELNYKLKNELEIQYEIANTNLYSTKYTNSLVQRVLEKSSGQFTNDELTRDAKLMSLGCSLTGGKLEGALYKQRQPEDSPFKSITPTIDICGELGESDTKIAVYCEDILITEPPNFYEAVLCTYAVYWIFNLCYERSAKPFFEELDCLIGE